MNDEQLKSTLENLLNKTISTFSLRWNGAVNNAYYVETTDGSKYVLKHEREDKEFQPRNDLLVEAKIAKALCTLDLCLAVSPVVAVSEDPKMYAYEYVEGDLLKEVWLDMSEAERVQACHLLGRFHAELGVRVNKEIVEGMGAVIDMSTELHPIVAQEYASLSHAADLPCSYTDLVKKAMALFDKNDDKLVFQFLHNDSHPENFLVKERVICGVIDFGESEYGEVTKEFSRYIRDLPDHFHYIISSYEKFSGNKLSRARLVSNAFISDFADIVEDYRKGGGFQLVSEQTIAKYNLLLREFI